MGHKNEGKDTFVLNGGTKMTIKIVSVVVLCLLSAFSAFAQNDQGDNIGGGGTTNYIPVFTGSHKIGWLSAASLGTAALLVVAECLATLKLPTGFQPACEERPRVPPVDQSRSLASRTVRMEPVACFKTLPGGILLGSTGLNNLFRVDGNGTVYADGGFQPNGADFAESMAVVGDRSKYGAGDLLVIAPSANRHLALARERYSSLVAGIYSTKPGMLGSTRRVDETADTDEVPLAVMGIVPCKVSAENGPIQVGDLLVSSSTPGHAMRGTDRSRMLGAVVEKALEPLPHGRGVIQVLVTLQ